MRKYKQVNKKIYNNKWLVISGWVIFDQVQRLVPSVRLGVVVDVLVHGHMDRVRLWHMHSDGYGLLNWEGHLFLYWVRYWLLNWDVDGLDHWYGHGLWYVHVNWVRLSHRYGNRLRYWYRHGMGNWYCYMFVNGNVYRFSYFNSLTENTVTVLVSAVSSRESCVRKLTEQQQCYTHLQTKQHK